MRSEKEIIEQLSRLFERRLTLRFDRKLKPMCRNCTHKQDVSCETDGVHYVKYSCSKGLPFMKEGACPEFKCAYSEASIREEMVRDIVNPTTRGAKEPQIAALVWVLNGGDGWMAKLKSFFK